ncbi:hypothetical protein [Arthrobacter sp. JSM 101049]|uniref:hypothetical protein n=1 Tax=Arthrobacter sp. JSM 101049 TaxID=929097 RepID=UPI003568B913
MSAELTPENLAAIRERASQGFLGQQHIAEADASALLAEVERLTEEAVAANSVLARYIVDRTAFSDALAIDAVPSIVDAIMRELTADSDRRAKVAEARLDRVRALVGEIGADGCLGYDECCAEPVVQRIAQALDGSDQ